jgi:hypothetical protein
MVSAITLNALVPILLLLVVLTTDFWVYQDSGSRLAGGEPVTGTLGPFRLESPTVCFIACLVLWIVAFPLYLVARSQS